jgi:hypothetical protein
MQTIFFNFNLKENIPSQYSKIVWKKPLNLGESLGGAGGKKNPPLWDSEFSLVAVV